MWRAENSFNGRLLAWMGHPACEEDERIALRLLINEGQLISRPDVQLAIGREHGRPDWSELFELFWSTQDELSQAQGNLLDAVLSLVDLRSIRLHNFLGGLNVNDAVRVLKAAIQANGLSECLTVATYAKASALNLKQIPDEDVRDQEGEHHAGPVDQCESQV